MSICFIPLTRGAFVPVEVGESVGRAATTEYWTKGLQDNGTTGPRDYGTEFQIDSGRPRSEVGGRSGITITSAITMPITITSAITMPITITSKSTSKQELIMTLKVLL
jgi:hypothetical protein